MLKKDCYDLIAEGKVIPAVRADSEEQALKIANACKDGGIKSIEVTMAVPGALKVIERLAADLEGFAIGAGTVLDGETARLAILSGASYVVGPCMRQDIIDVCKRYGVLSIIGGFTSTEVLKAYEAGADMVEIFPVGSAGPLYVKAITAVFPQIPIIAAGGINLDNARTFMRARVVAVGVSSALIDKKMVREGNYDAIKEKAVKFMEAAEYYRSCKI
jgi:2-dehydro-3-deoxyphosphogluconate aldolase / (4S)-4-hydroxy-2-oxoglutarate aldolase